jgi:hypothetical protein
MQIDFGEKLVTGGRRAGSRAPVRCGVLGYSRRLFTRASLSQRQDDWREGLAGAFRHFGGVPRRLLLDNAGALGSWGAIGKPGRRGCTQRSKPSAGIGASRRVSASRTGRAPRARRSRASDTSNAMRSPD